MYLVYRLLLTLGFIVLIPRFLFDALRHGKYVAGFGQRLGGLSPLETSNPVVWIHCVSVGEAQAARPLVSKLRQTLPQHKIVISTTTLTGQRLATDIFQKDAARVFYFPFDWRWTVRRSLRAIHPELVLIMETEIWPGFFRECKSRNIPLAIVNGRLSQQSCRRYLWVRGFIKRVLRDLSFAVMQTQADADRIESLGLDTKRIGVSGSIKFDAGLISTSDRVVAELRDRFGMDGARPVIIAASTHEPEERVVLEAINKIQVDSAPRLVIAPRHPERFDEVASLLAESGCNWVRRSSLPSPADKTADVILLDSIGELSSVYSLGTVVFVGGSIANSGGHNILEPVAAGAAVITGPHTHNFKAIITSFVAGESLVQLPASSEDEIIKMLAEALQKLLTNKELRIALQRRARTLLEQNLGATDRTLAFLEPLLHPGNSSQQEVPTGNGARV